MFDEAQRCSSLKDAIVGTSSQDVLHPRTLWFRFCLAKDCLLMLCSGRDSLSVADHPVLGKGVENSQENSI
jgi:hypothetical protein